MGVPVLTMELAVGRASRRSAVLGYKALEKPGQKWHIHGWFCLLGCCLLMMYYTTVTGWMVSYFFKFLTGTFSQGMATEAVSAVFGNLLSSPGEMAIWTEIVVLAGFVVCSFGLQNGLERITKGMMLALLVLILVLAIHSLTLSGAAEGMKFYLLPSVDSIKENGLGNVITAAMNQAFFTLSLGIAAMEIFGSYMGDEHRLTGESVRICALDTFVALMSGMIIFPACFSFNVEPNQGPSLIFDTLPNVFVNMAGGRLWGTLFFLFMTFASFLAVASLPCVLGYNLWSDLTFIGGRDVLDSEDFLVSNLLLPIGSLVFLLFCVSKWGWGFDKYLAEANKGENGPKLPRWLKPYFQWILPILILVILIQGLL